jgi:hypothetical protein
LAQSLSRLTACNATPNDDSCSSLSDIGYCLVLLRLKVGIGNLERIGFPNLPWYTYPPDRYDRSSLVRRRFLVLSHVTASQEVHTKWREIPRLLPDDAIAYELPQPVGIQVRSIFRLWVLYPFVSAFHGIALLLWSTIRPRIFLSFFNYTSITKYYAERIHSAAAVRSLQSPGRAAASWLALAYRDSSYLRGALRQVF